LIRNGMAPAEWAWWLWFRFAPECRNSGGLSEQFVRIVQLIPDFALGGVQKAGCVLGEHLAKRGHEVFVIGGDGGPRRQCEPNAAAPAARHFVVPVDLQGDKLAELKPDVLHVHSGRYESAGLDRFTQRAELAGTVIVVTPVFGRPPADRDVLKRVKTCCVGLYTYYRLLRWLSLSGEQAVKDGFIFAPLTPFQPPKSAVAATQPAEIIARRRGELGLSASSFIVGRIGRNAPDKWSPRTSESIDSLLTTFPDVAWLSIGMPAERGAGRLTDAWPGRFINVPEMADYERLCGVLSCLDVQLFFSVYGECFASSICEAAGLGVPTLALSTPLNDNGQAEQVIDGVTGFLLGNSDDAMMHIKRLRETPGELARLKQSTSDYALRHWHADVVAARLERAYEDWVCGGPVVGELAREIVDDHRSFLASYRRRVIGLAARNAWQRAALYAALAAAEFYPTFTIGKRFKRWRPF
jgi:glycosyltransferase involved in cell wall biosynthesis